MLCFTSTTRHLTTKNCLKYKTQQFKDSEYFFVIQENIKACDITLVHATCPPVNNHVIELVILVDALKNAGASAIHLIMPYFGYGRQDRAGNLISPSSFGAKVVSRIIEQSGIDSLSILDVHAPHVFDSLSLPIHHLSVIPSFASIIKHEFHNKEILLVSPDKGARARCEYLSKLTKSPFICLQKERVSNSRVHHTGSSGRAKGKHCIIVDDVVDSGNTLISAATLLRNGGALSVSAFVVHAVSLKNEELYCIKNIWVSNSIHHVHIPFNVAVLSITEYLELQKYTK